MKKLFPNFVKDFLKNLYKKFYKIITPVYILADYLDEFNKKNKIYFSQEGEDIVLNRLFENKIGGFYIDIGAHHPTRFSNTYFFYLKGWRGINVDAMPGSMKKFNELRPLDINLELAVSDKNEILNYYQFNDPALNTFSINEVELIGENSNYFVENTLKIPTITLAQILDKHVNNSNVNIDFMSIDVEGLDLNVLKSNNWEKYRPTILLVESLREELYEISNSETFKFLEQKGYKLVAKTVNTFFYKLKNN